MKRKEIAIMEDISNIPTLEDLLNFATLAKERDVEALKGKAEVAAAAALMGPGAIRAVAKNWACSTHTVNRYAAIGDKLPLGEIVANDPRLFSACIDADGADNMTAADWYWWAIHNEDGTRSARQVRDAADLKRGRRTSRVAWLNDGNGRVVSVATGEKRAVVTLNVERPTGKQPKTVEVIAYAVFEEAQE